MLKYLSLLLIVIACLMPKVGFGDPIVTSTTGNAAIATSKIGAGPIGEPAPALMIKEWVKGAPVEIKPGTNIFVLEIWNTKGPASRAAIPVMNRIQANFKTNGVVVVGISDEEVPDIKDFMQHEGTNIDYTIAADDHRQTSLIYMGPAGQLAVPSAFIVGTNGNLLWEGHAFHGLETALEQIVTGHYDLERAKKIEVAEHQMEQYLTMARRSDARTRVAGAVLLANRTNDLDLLCDLAFAITTAPKVPNRDFALADQALDQAESLAPTNSAHVMIYRSLWLFQSGQHEQGITLATRALSVASPDEKSSVRSLLDTMKQRMQLLQMRKRLATPKNNAPTSGQAAGASPNSAGGAQDKALPGTP